MEEPKKPQLALILDTNVFIKMIDMREKYEADFYSVPEVIAEIKDEKARIFVDNLPYKLQTRSPIKESQLFVTEFAKQTGDFLSLSVADLKVIALAHTLMMERSEHIKLRGKPLSQPENTDKLAERFAEEAKEVKEEAEEMEGNNWITPENIDRGVFFGKERITKSAPKPKEAEFSVGVVTSDFSMQNVILQMGIPLFSIDGKMISTVRQFVHRCRACREVNKNPKTQFCSACGNPMLEKVSVYVNSDGTVNYGRFRKKVNLRGTVYSIPKPKGGRDANDLILREDELLQPKIQRMIKKQEKDKERVVLSAMDDFESIGLSHSTAGTKRQANTKMPRAVTIGYGKKNPNVARKYYSKKQHK